jgi:hypothetical protein
MLRTIVWVVILVLALSFFGISLKALVADSTTQDNFSFILDLVRSGWEIIEDWFMDLRDSARDLIPNR